MGWRILQLSKPCKLSVKHKQLVYESDEITTTFPIEDLSVVILETNFVQLSGTVLSEFASNGVVLISCNGSHMPSGTFFPFHDNSRYSEMANMQITSPVPLRKRLWQQIIKQKILNQSCVLTAMHKDNPLIQIAKNVQSGDTTNREAFAAQLYWNTLFKNFIRRDDANIINKALNYGYAVVRACVARNLVASGLLPCFGLHHASQLNQFNMADDLIEPFRPFVDYMVANMDLQNIHDLNPELKNQIISVLLCDCMIDGECVTLVKAIEIASTSLAKSIRTRDILELRLPTLLPIKDKSCQ